MENFQNKPLDTKCAAQCHSHLRIILLEAPRGKLDKIFSGEKQYSPFNKYNFVYYGVITSPGITFYIVE